MVGALARTVLPLAEAGIPGLLLEKQLTPQSWLWPGQGTVVLLWRMWLVGSSASPEGNGVQPGEVARALAQGREDQSWPCGWVWSHSQAPGTLLSCPGVPMCAGVPLRAVQQQDGQPHRVGTQRRCHYQLAAKHSLHQIHTSSHTSPTFTGSNYTMKTTLRE